MNAAVPAAVVIVAGRQDVLLAFRIAWCYFLHPLESDFKFNLLFCYVVTIYFDLFFRALSNIITFLHFLLSIRGSWHFYHKDNFSLEITWFFLSKFSDDVKTLWQFKLNSNHRLPSLFWLSTVKSELLGLPSSDVNNIGGGLTTDSPHFISSDTLAGAVAGDYQSAYAASYYSR